MVRFATLLFFSQNSERMLGKSQVMTSIKRNGFWLLISWIMSLSLAQESRSEIIQFTLNPALSSLTFNGNANVAGFGNFILARQGPTGVNDPNSLITQFTGTVTADVNSFLNPSSIQFNSASIVASNNGSWLPTQGNISLASPANYGFTADIGNGAIRNLSFNLTSGVMSISGGSFAPATQLFTNLPGGTLHIGGPLGFSDVNMTSIVTSNPPNRPNTTLTNATVTSTASLLTISLPVDFNFDYNIPGNPNVNGNFRYSGSLAFTAVPEPTSFLLLGSCGIVGGIIRWRKRRVIV